jgi:hypothetical protein
VTAARGAAHLPRETKAAPLRRFEMETTNNLFYAALEVSKALTNITCYKQSADECDEESYTCCNCGKTMCFSHSNRHETEGRFCDDCVAY